MQLGLETAVALALGLAVGSAASVRAVLLAGAAPAARIALRVGIMLLGARLTLGQLLETGAASIVAIVVVVGRSGCCSGRCWRGASACGRRSRR